MKEFKIKIDRDLMAILVSETHRLDRKWRKLLEIYPELRGLDYADKDESEIKTINEIYKN